MSNDWGVIGCGYMAREYCKALISLGVSPEVYSRDLASANVTAFQTQFPDVEVQTLGTLRSDAKNWMVCTNVESHEEICSRLDGQIWCEKPYAHTSAYEDNPNISVLMNRRYYYWVERMQGILEAGKIVKIIASIPESSAAALITQSIHVVDLLWYLAGPFRPATRIGEESPSYFFSTADGIPIVINMNYGAHENFSLRFYGKDGVVYEAKPIEAFSLTAGMEVREPDDDMPLRTYRPIVRPMAYAPTAFKPGVGELVEDLVRGTASRLPGLAQHRQIHVWMERNML